MTEEIKTENFDSVFFEEEKSAARVSAPELAHFIGDEDALRNMIAKRKITYQNEHGLNASASYEELEDACMIDMDTIKKTINGRVRV